LATLENVAAGFRRVATASRSASKRSAYTWQRDRRPLRVLDHQVDGVATRDSLVELVEVELTAKSTPRYKQIYDNHSMRLTGEGVSRVAYFYTADADRIVNREADRLIFATAGMDSVGFELRDRAIGASYQGGPRARRSLC